MLRDRMRRTLVSNRSFRVLNDAHRAVVRITGGRLGKRVAGMPVLEVTTTGRRSGRPHTLRLTTPMREGPAIVLVASRAGDDRHPDWYLNIVAHPEVQIREPGGQWQPMRARPATDAERDRLWPRLVADNRWYRSYETKTGRVIPLVLVEPA